MYFYRNYTSSEASLIAAPLKYVALWEFVGSPYLRIGLELENASYEKQTQKRNMTYRIWLLLVGINIHLDYYYFTTRGSS